MAETLAARVALPEPDAARPEELTLAEGLADAHVELLGDNEGVTAGVGHTLGVEVAVTASDVVALTDANRVDVTVVVSECVREGELDSDGEAVEEREALCVDDAREEELKEREPAAERESEADSDGRELDVAVAHGNAVVDAQSEPRALFETVAQAVAVPQLVTDTLAVGATVELPLLRDVTL